ncbi:hypothetical protein KUTeg_016315 [Tegillarca granosa]|uniref:Uncharacterized protein n=1 Tax=Tegillarca granosa TaxID=220873 RepID=A0ABQ9EQD2_TEGGR|nr:hypothetical protein KUTeg_016315 [Tegillarca granosa]
MDAAIMIVQSLINKYPKVDAKLFIGGKQVGINPKINNMITGYEAAKFDLILVNDSGLKVTQMVLSQLAEEIQVALVSNETDIGQLFPKQCRNICTKI